VRPLIPLVLLALAWCSTSAPPLPAKFASDDVDLTLFLDESVSGAHLMIGYGYLDPLEVAWAGATIAATIGTDVAVAGGEGRAAGRGVREVAAGGRPTRVRVAAVGSLTGAAQHAA
jgi:hypothetical protein